MSGPFAKLFGRPQLLVDGRELALAPLQLALIGLVFGHEREGLGRAEVATMLWQTGHEGTLRRRLSQLLYELTQAGGDPALLRVGDTLSRPPGSRSELDEVDALFDAGRFREAASIVTRGFLDVLPTVPTSEYQTWLDGRRHALRRLVRARASAQWALAEGQGRWGPRALSSAQALYLLDPANEAAMRNVMWAQALCASPTEALATYDAFFDAHNERTTAPPSTETRTLLQRVRSLARQKSGTAGPVRRGPPEPRMYGREAAVAKLRPLLIDPEEDCLTTVAIAGEAGLGKTRLLNESLSAATLQGRLVLHARLAELEKDVALNALTEALSTREVAEVLARVEEPWRSVVLQFLPEFAQVAGGPLEVPEIQRDSVHRRLLESLRQVFLAIGERHSFVLVLDDLHWIDDSSLAALEYVRRRWDEGAGTIVVTYRPEHVVDGSKLDVFLRSEGVRHLDLQPLDPPSQKQLIAELGGEELSPSAADRIVGLARGNPLFLIELTRQWVEAGAEPFSETATDLSVPTSIRRLFDRRLASLPRAAIRVLEAISVWGRVATLSDLEALAESDADTIANALEDLDRAGLVRWTDQGTELWHELLRQSVLGRISGARRQLLHRRAALRLEKSLGEGVAGEIALHADRGKLEEYSARFGRIAAAVAEEAGALREAIALHDVVARNARDEDDRIAARVQQASLECRIWDWVSAIPRLESALSDLRSSGKADEEVELLLLSAKAQSGQPSSSLSSDFDCILERLREQSEWDALAMALDAALHYFEYSGELPSRLPRARVLLRECLEHGTPAARARASRLQVLEAFLGSPEVADKASVESLVIAESSGLSGEVLDAYANRIVLLICTGKLHLDANKELIERSLSLSKRRGDLTVRCALLSNLGAYHVECGHLEKGRSFLDECLNVVPEGRFHPDTLRVFANVGELELEAGDYQAARVWFERCLSSLADGAGAAITPLVGIGLCALEEGRLREATKIVAGVESKFERRPFSHEISYYYKLRAEISLRKSDYRAAVSELRDAADMAWNRRVTVWLRAQLWLCRLMRRLDDPHLSKEAMRGWSVAKDLQLDLRARQFQRLRADANRAQVTA